MDAISSSNVSQTKGTKKNQRRRGDDTEIIKIENAKLWFMGGQAHNRIVGVVKEGDFMIRLVMQSLSPALMTICVVQKTEWPLTKDYLVMRVGFRSFAFAMPGLLYGLQLTPNCYDEIFETLERIFMRFGYYKDLTGRQTKGVQVFGPDDDPYFWSSSVWKIEHINNLFLQQLSTYWRKEESFMRNMNDRVSRVEQMSFVVKLITTGLLIRKIDPIEHIEVIGKRPPSEDDDDDEIDSRSSPTIYLFAALVKAFEEAKVRKNPGFNLPVPSNRRRSPIPNTTFWNMNKNGLNLILKVIKTAVAKMDFEVPIASEPVRGPPAFFVAMEIDLNTAPEMADVSPREIIFPILSQEANAMPREIRFPILDEVGSSWKVNKNNIVDQMGLAGVNLKLGYMN